MSESTPWNCTCGELRLTVEDVPRGGTHIVCYCADCRAFAKLRDAAETLDAAGGVGLYQTSPEAIEIAGGADRLRCLRLTPRGPYRWYAACCGAPVANTAPRRGVPFVSLMGSGFGDGVLDRPRARVHRQGATGRVPKPHGSLVGAMAAILRRTALSRLSGGWRRTPFFGEDGAPVSAPDHPDPQAMRMAYSRLP